MSEANQNERMVSPGAALIAAERQRQVEQEGWDAEHDEDHTDQSLVLAAVCYALPAKLRGRKTIRERDDVSGGRGECPVWGDVSRRVPKFWPESWWSGWWRPNRYDRVRELVKAGALIAAEIDRLQRLEG